MLPTVWEAVAFADYFTCTPMLGFQFDVPHPNHSDYMALVRLRENVSGLKVGKNVVIKKCKFVTNKYIIKNRSCISFLKLIHKKLIIFHKPYIIAG